MSEVIESIDTSESTNLVAMTVPQLVPIKDIYYDAAFNVRGDVTHSSVIELAGDIAVRGLQDAITIRPMADGGPYKYSIVCGHRRFRAHQWNNATHIAAKIVRMTEMDAIRINILENVHREPLNFLQEAMAVKHLKDLHHSIGQITGFLKKSSNWVKQRLALMDLPEQAHEMARLGILKPSHVLECRDLKQLSAQFKFLRDLKTRTKKTQAATLAREAAKPQADRDKKDPENGFLRGKTAISEMQDRLYSVLGPSFEVRLLGWAAGYVSDNELYDDLQAIADARGKLFVRPTDSLSAV